jgi:hypothetical protein
MVFLGNDLTTCLRCSTAVWIAVVKEIQEVEQQASPDEQEVEQLKILEAYAATIEGALNLDGVTPFQYGGLRVEEALTRIQTSLTRLQKGGSR